MTQGRVIGKLLTPSLAVAAAFAILPISARAAEVDLTVVGDTPQPVAADFGGNGLVANFHTHPSGTGVFDPFLTLERNAAGGNSSGIESAYNTDGHSGLYLDQQRPEWNTYLKLSDLAVVDVGGAKYYAFELDANEPGNTKSLISIDNIRIYTSASDNTALVQNNEGNLKSLGTLRWAMNDPLNPAGTTQNPGNYNIDKWIKLDANLSDVLSKANGGSGFSDLIMYIPIGQLSPVSLKKIRVVHVLDGYDKREIAKDYIW